MTCVVFFPLQNSESLLWLLKKIWRRPFSHEKCVGNIFLMACLVLLNLCLQKKKSTESCVFRKGQNSYLVHILGAGQLIYISNAWGWGAVFICWSHLFFFFLNNKNVSIHTAENGLQMCLPHPPPQTHSVMSQIYVNILKFSNLLKDIW